MTSRGSLWGSGVPGGREVGREGARTGGSDRVGEGARVRQDGADEFRVVRDHCLFFPCAAAVCGPASRRSALNGRAVATAEFVLG